MNAPPILYLKSSFLIHPDIRKFWEDSGYRVMEFDSVMENIGLESSNTLYYAHKDNRSYLVADISKYKKYYHFHPSQMYLISEEQMLRIIKMKAFL